MITSLGLINLSDTLPQKFESHRGGRLIDFCLISPNLSSAIESFGYLTYDQITSTDHRLMFLDLNIQELFNHKPDSPMLHSSRILKTHLLQRKNKYLELKLATVVRDQNEADIPVSSTINRKNSDIFGQTNAKYLANATFSQNQKLH